MKKIGCYFTLLLFVGCKEKYVPKVNTPASGFLVVEGLIDAGTGPTRIQLSRVSGLDSIYTIYEGGAAIEVQSSNGASYPLAEQSKGKYEVDQVPVDPGQQYRLHIKTSGGEEYLSDFTEVKISPPIDSVSWSSTAEQVRVDVTTHDAGKNSVYYQWEYIETWKYTSSYGSDFIVDSLGNEIYSVIRRPDSLKLPRICWITDTSTQIIIASTAKLQEDIIDHFPINFIPFSASNRLGSRYTMLVKQSVLTKEDYEWKQKIQKNTEQIGTIFDAQPSETGGNIHSVTNPSEKVIGFIGCSSVTEKRIFIDRSQIPSVSVYNAYQDCEESPFESVVRCLVCPDPLPDLFLESNEFAITGTVGSPPNVTSIKVAPMTCVDCRLKGGVPYPPSYWQ